MRVRWRKRHALATVVLSLAAPCALASQSTCPPVPAPTRTWPTPLDHVITLRAGQLSLRDALDRLAVAAGVRLSYSTEALPLDQRVCATYTDIAFGDALSHVLEGIGVQPTIVSSTQVVLVPHGGRRPAVEPPPATPPSMDVLDRIVVTGSTGGEDLRSAAVHVDVVTGEELVTRADGSLARALTAQTVGLWAWDPAPTAMALRYGSVRGTSSFGVNAPKIYIDGIAVANPVLLSQLVPETIDRIEVIRGPQGAALYGADAISGVVNITTRHDAFGATASHVQVRSTLGLAGSAWAPSGSGVLTRDLAAAFRAGSDRRVGGASASYRSIGEFIPGAFGRDLLATADFRHLGARSTFTATTRVFSRDAGTSSPLLDDLLTDRSQSGTSVDQGAARPMSGVPFSRAFGPSPRSGQSLREYTVGSTLRVAPNERWTHTFVAGIDGYALAGDASPSVPLLSASDSALHDARGEAARITLRASTLRTFSPRASITNALTVAAEQTVTRQETAAREFVAVPRLTPGRDSVLQVRSIEWRRTSGLVGQLNSSFARTLYLTAGLRFEGSTSAFGAGRTDALPILGLAVVRDIGRMTLKLRSAYGRGMRIPQLTVRERALFALGTLAIPYDLPPETQAGIEVGLDATVGSRLAFHVTRFEQEAAGLKQMVAASSTTSIADPYGRVAYELQNVGRIANRGWEFSLQSSHGPLVLTGSLSLTQSKVLELAHGYSGDLRAGDRPLEMPARTVSLTAGWNGLHWTSSIDVSRATDWVNYDRLALADAFARSIPSAQPRGPALRTFWRTYDGVTRLRATFARDIFRSLSLIATGENLLDAQRGEPDNITILPGRTISAGLRVRF